MSPQSYYKRHTWKDGSPEAGVVLLFRLPKPRQPVEQEACMTSRRLQHPDRLLRQALASAFLATISLTSRPLCVLPYSASIMTGLSVSSILLSATGNSRRQFPDLQGGGRAEMHTPSMSVPRVKPSASKASRLTLPGIKKVSVLLRLHDDPLRALRQPNQWHANMVPDSVFFWTVALIKGYSPASGVICCHAAGGRYRDGCGGGELGYQQARRCVSAKP